MDEIENSFENLMDCLLEINMSIDKKKKLVDSSYDFLDKIQELANEQNQMKKRIAELEEYVYNDFDEFDENTSFVCPYCNRNVQVYMNNEKMDMACPFCKNEVILEWSKDND